MARQEPAFSAVRALYYSFGLISLHLDQNCYRFASIRCSLVHQNKTYVNTYLLDFLFLESLPLFGFVQPHELHSVFVRLRRNDDSGFENQLVFLKRAIIYNVLIAAPATANLYNVWVLVL